MKKFRILVCLFLIFCFAFFWIGCQYKNSLLPNEDNLKISTELINNFLSSGIGHRKVTNLYCDSFLIYRHELFEVSRSMIKFEPPKKYPIFEDYQIDSLHLVIPDSLRGQINYIDNSITPSKIECDTLNVFFFTPLLPTKIKGVYFFHTYMIGNYKYEENTRKYAVQKFTIYQRKGEKWKKIDEMYSEKIDLGSGLKEPGTIKPKTH